MKRLRPQAQNLRRALGVVVALTALAIAFNLDRHAQTAVPDYVKAIQDRVERSDRAERELAKVRGATRETSSGLRDYGAAPGFTGIGQWINTPGERPLSLAGLRGKVVLVDFWTYSCINCLRTFPHLRAWDRTYRSQGLVTVGVHTPEFAFEHVEGNVRSAVKRFGLDYPIAMDNDFGTWNAFQNRYWPAKYLIDARGHLRYAHFGEGAYDTTESNIRDLLAERKDALPAPVSIADRTPEQFAGDALAPDKPAAYRFPRRQLAVNEIAYAGQMTVERQRFVAGLGARLRLHFQAQVVHLVLGGQGPVEVFLDGRKQNTVQVDESRLYTLLRLPRVQVAQLELRFSPGVSAYAFTFG
jgi:thiol-disulfide isomerase/thioredoxin